MKIFPRSKHFKVTMYVNSIIGLWPFVFKDHPLLHRLYDLYSKFILTVFVLFVTSTSIEVIRLVTVVDTSAQEVFKNLCITLLDAIILTKAFVMRSPKMVGLIREVIDVEEQTRRSKDGEVIRIYESFVYETHRTSIIFMVNYILVTFSYYFVPLVTPIVTYNAATNETIIERELPGSAWVPWDAQRYYWASYGWHLYAGGIAASSVMSMDIFMFSLIIFPLGQIDVLCHNLRNFKDRTMVVQSRLGCCREKASLVVLKKCALKHKDIIRYISDFNDGVKYVMVFDFLVSSIQLAAIVIQVVGVSMALYAVLYHSVSDFKLHCWPKCWNNSNFYGNFGCIYLLNDMEYQNMVCSMFVEISLADLAPLDLLLWCSFVLCMLMRLFVYYWYANEIMVKSLDIGDAIWHSSWVEEPYTIKQSMLIMIIRTQRELGLDIGPFSRMSLQSFVNIVKGAYSYVTVMYR